MAYTAIVCGVTGSAHSQKAALHGAILAKEHNARLIYVYAVDASFLKGGRTVELSRSFAEESLEHLGGHILNYAEQLAESQGITPKKVLRKGSVLEVLKQVVSEEKADLLLLGHENRTFFEKTLLKGSVEEHAQSLEKQTGASVLIFTEK